MNSLTEHVKSRVVVWGTSQNGNIPRRFGMSPIWLFPKRQQIQNGDKSNLISLQNAVFTCIQNGDTPKRRQIQLDFYPKCCVDLYPRRQQIQNGDTVKTATVQVDLSPKSIQNGKSTRRFG